MRARVVRPAKMGGALLLVAAAVSGSPSAGPRPQSAALPPSSAPASTSAPVRPSPNTGVVWQTEVAASGYALVGDTVVAAWHGGVTGIEAHTGSARWRYQPPSGFDIVSWEATGGVVALAMDTSAADPGADFSWETVGLEAATGQPLWDQTRVELLPPPDHFEPGGPPDRLASGGGMIVVPWYSVGDDSHLGLAGVDARTGALDWTQPFDELVIGGVGQCDITAGRDIISPSRPLVAANDQIAAVVAQCAQGQVVIGFDPRTGRARWATPLRGGQPKRLIVDEDAILVGQLGPGTILDADGRVVFEGDLPSDLPVMAVAGDIAVISGQDGANDPLIAVDLRSGQTLWSRPRPSADHPMNTLRRNAYQGLTAVDNAILGYRSAAGGGPPDKGMEPDQNLLPVVVDRIDPSTGAVQPTPIPVTGEGTWVMAVGDLLLLESGRGLAAIRLTPGGSLPSGNAPASPDRWPDACALVTADRVQALWPGRQPTPVGESGSVLGSPIPNPFRCQFTDLDGSVVVAVTIGWVAGDPRSAETLATSARSLSAGVILWSQSPEEPLLPAVGTWAFGEPATHVTLRAGPAIAHVRSWDIAVPAVEIARLVTERLHALGYR
ncbi:outer membrane protein assembly factor BamB family protein [Saccharothrix deserti]|uniref:outer membrane protein assembly factor BamB family protein n=1 Tax=Saccharothrix deserti TaxID=2593674 RepID=UPI00131AE80E|nr:PQQ-binding-like beta-propeller repeat protein [Saccharothrix deserti]